MPDAASTTSDGNESEVENKAGRHNSSRARAKSPGGTERTIEPVTLAAMLRESANVVEKNEFDPLLYQALQDFRAYYKHHQPKKKEEKSKRRRARKVAPNNTTTAPSSVSDSEQPVLVPDDEPPHIAPNEMAGPSPTAASSTTGKTVPEPAVAKGSTSWAFSAAEATKTPTEETADPVIETAIPVPPPPSHSTEDSAPSSIPTDKVPSEPAFSPEPSPSTVSKNSASHLFGSFKFPKVHIPIPNPAFVATSKKNAARAKADLEEFAAGQGEGSPRRSIPDLGQQPTSSGVTTSSPPGGHESEWCEVHFTMGCACKSRTKTDGRSDSGIPTEFEQAGHPSSSHANATTKNSERNGYGNDIHASSSSFSGAATTTTGPGASNTSNKQPSSDPTMAAAATQQQQPQQHKPPYQRPLNPNSTLIANGWIEQQRRSKMRTVWKDVLASLVAGRKPGEETTLWIQREVTNPVSGKKELEALHQVPIKWLQEVSHLDYATDNRFALRVYNLQEEFMFRCSTDQAAKNWVKTLRNAQEAVQGTKQSASSRSKVEGWDNPARHSSENSSFDNDEKKGNDGPRSHTPPQPRHPQPPPDHGAASSSSSAAPSAAPQQPQPQQQQRMTIRDLRALCHGAGINTVGMERSELERAAAEVSARGTYFAPPNASSAAPVAAAAAAAAGASSAAPAPMDEARARQQELRRQEELRARQEEIRRQEELKLRQEELRRRQEMEAAEELRRREEEMLDAKKRKQIDEETRRRVEDERRKAEEDARRRQVEEEMRSKQAEEEHRRRLAEQERLRQLAEKQAAEKLRQQQEEALRAQQQWQRQQHEWQKQQQEDQERRRMAELAEQQAAEARRRQEEAFRHWQRQQQQQQQQHHAQPPPQQPHFHPGQQPHPQHHHQQQQQWHQQQQWQQQQQQQQQRPPPPQNQKHSASDDKYAQMANQSNDGAAATTRIKHDILIHWALQPPQLQMLRPIEVLVTTIQGVFPPALGVSGHDYFTTWTPYTTADLVDEGGRPDDGKLKKAVRKIRFFLHPDKLPRDLNPEQTFLVKMLWDVTNDAYEEFHKKNEELDWINK